MPAPAPAAAPPPGSERIVGGRPASQEYPYAALLRVDGRQRCGGALIAARYVLTAAHCLTVEGAPARTVEVALGNVVVGPGLEYLRAEAWEAHPEHGNRRGYDAAWIRLPFATGREQLRLPRTGESGLWAPGVTARAIGWGLTEDHADGGTATTRLLETDLPVLSDAACHEQLGAWGGAAAQAYFDSETMVCAGGGTERDTCDGDSGAPLLVPDGRRFALGGLVSFGLGPDEAHTCAEGPPAFYARTGAEPLNAWIRNRVPQVEIDVWPPRPEPGDLVRLDARPSGPEPYMGFTWDLDGDGGYDDATGATVVRRFRAGLHEVGLRGGRGIEAERRRIALAVGADPAAAASTASEVRVTPLHRRSRVRGRRFRLAYRTTVEGTVSIAAQRLRSRRTLARAVRRPTRSGTHHATLRLNRAGRRDLRAAARRGRTLTVRLILAIEGGEDRRTRRAARLRLAP